MIHIMFSMFGCIKAYWIGIEPQFSYQISRDYLFPRFGDMPGLVTNKICFIGTVLPMLIYLRSGPVPEQSWTDCCGNKFT